MAYRLKGRCGYPQDEPFRPTFHPDRLLEPLEVKKPSKIFTVSMGEFFDTAVKDVWRGLVLEIMNWSLNHQFLILTKQVEELANYFEVLQLHPPGNLWLGISQDGKTTNDNDIEFFRSLNYIPKKFVSFEPLLGPITSNFYGIDWIIIGAQTGPRAQQPRREWVHDILLEADNWDIPVFIKNNLQWKGNTQRPQEWPEVKT